MLAESYAAIAKTLIRLAETQQNMPVPMTWAERCDLRDAAKILIALLEQQQLDASAVKV